MKILSSKWTIWLVLLLSVLAASGLLAFKFYYWQILDDTKALPAYELWHLALLPFAVVTLLALIILLFNRNSISAGLSLLLCVFSGVATYYVPYQVHYLDVYNAFYDDAHELDHNVNELMHHLIKADYDWLDTYLLTAHKRVLENPNKEDYLINAYGKFEVPVNTEVKKHLDAWVNTSKSYQAYTARAYYLMSHGWKVRGNSYSRDIADSAYKKMRILFNQSKSDLLNAVNIEPNNIAAYYGLIEIYAVLGEKKNIDITLQNAINLNPYTYYARNLYMQKRLFPQWGGSKEKMYEFSLSVREFAHGNPRLMALMTTYYKYEAGLLNNESKTDAAIKMYERALEYAHFNSIHMALARIYKGQPDKLLQQYNSIIKKSPLSLDARASRAVLVFKNGNIELALEDAKVVHEFANENYYLTPVGWVFESVGKLEEAVDCYSRAINYAAEDTYALTQLVSIYSRQGETQKALDVALKMTKVSSVEAVGNLLAADYMFDLNNKQAVEYIDLFYSQLESGASINKSYVDSAKGLRNDIYKRFNINSPISVN